MHHVSEKSQAIRSSVAVLHLLKKKEEWNAWAAISRTLNLNMIPMKLKVAINTDASVQYVLIVTIMWYFDKPKESSEQPTSAF